MSGKVNQCTANKLVNVNGGIRTATLPRDLMDQTKGFEEFVSLYELAMLASAESALKISTRDKVNTLFEPLYKASERLLKDNANALDVRFAKLGRETEGLVERSNYDDESFDKIPSKLSELIAIFMDMIDKPSCNDFVGDAAIRIRDLVGKFKGMLTKRLERLMVMDEQFLDQEISRAIIIIRLLGSPKKYIEQIKERFCKGIIFFGELNGEYVNVYHKTAPCVLGSTKLSTLKEEIKKYPSGIQKYISNLVELATIVGITDLTKIKICNRI